MQLSLQINYEPFGYCSLSTTHWHIVTKFVTVKAIFNLAINAIQKLRQKNVFLLCQSGKSVGKARDFGQA